MSQKYTLNSETETEFFIEKTLYAAFHCLVFADPRFILSLSVQNNFPVDFLFTDLHVLLFIQKPIHIEYQVNFLRFRSLDQ